MGFITREGSAPITDGEDIEAANVENEFSKIFGEINGGLDTTNLAAAAALVGTQLADGTIPSSKVTASTLTVTQMAASAVAKNEVSTANNTGALSSSATLVDVPGVSTITLDAGSTDDIVTMTLMVVIADSGAAAGEHHWGFNISDGTGDVLVGVSEFTVTGNTWVFQHVMQATVTTSVVYKPRYLLSSGTAGTWESTKGLDYTCLFQVEITPMKS